MKVVSTVDCYFGKGLRAAGVPFEYDKDIEPYPFLSAVDQEELKPQDEVKVSAPAEFDGGAAGQQQRDNALLSVLDNLDHSNDELWTTRGLPKVRAVEELVGFDTSGAEIKLLRPDLVRIEE